MWLHLINQFINLGNQQSSGHQVRLPLLLLTQFEFILTGFDPFSGLPLSTKTNSVRPQTYQDKAFQVPNPTLPAVYTEYREARIGQACLIQKDMHTKNGVKSKSLTGNRNLWRMHMTLRWVRFALNYVNGGEIDDTNNPSFGYKRWYMVTWVNC